MKKQIGNKKVRLVLGNGSAKGLSNIGAMTGGAYAAGISIYEIEDIACKTDLVSSMKYFVPTISKSGLISGVKVKEYLRNIVGDIDIENLQIPFTATGTLVGKCQLYEKRAETPGIQYRQ
ncbi:MAG: hypothetical protein COT43_05400 [Candidatus Marinimicrobia bacterium CG08_land_8_20_14_0_20_45_22]|nr:MAG: hypothetical protein COT43_05400 [Candidatus Marinimicrobia bacterium CG08_land_8_20_14_0_20_45_22]